jgi:hypothetical protein
MLSSLPIDSETHCGRHLRQRDKPCETEPDTPFSWLRRSARRTSNVPAIKACQPPSRPVRGMRLQRP